MKNLSFGKILAIFGGFMVVCLIGAIVAVKMTSKGNNATPVITKRYTPEESPPPAQPQPPAQAAQQAPAPQQAALQPTAPVGAALGQGAASQPATAGAAPVIAVPASSAPAQAAAPATPTAAPGDLGQQLASIDSKLNQFNARLSALEAGKGGGATAKPHARRATPARVQKAAPKEEIVEMPKPIKDAAGYKAMAVVGNRAWVATADGSEESLTAGEAIPAPRPRVRSVDPNTGVVIMTSDERINAR
jgi:DNA polymerase-3 subunit gamma/tau